LCLFCCFCTFSFGRPRLCGLFYRLLFTVLAVFFVLALVGAFFRFTLDVFRGLVVFLAFCVFLVCAGDFCVMISGYRFCGLNIKGGNILDGKCKVD